MIDRFETRRLGFRLLTMDDVDRMVALDSDPEVMRYITGGPAPSRDETEATLRSAIGHRWLAWESATGDDVGWFALDPSSSARSDERELGYRLFRSAWGRGFATEGSRALVALGFTRLRLRRIWAETMAVNTASRWVMERCGLTYVRTFHLEWDDPAPGTEHGEVEYELRAPDWDGRMPEIRSADPGGPPPRPTPR